MAAVDIKEEVAKVIAQVAVHKVAVFHVNGRFYKVVDDTDNIDLPPSYIPPIDKDIEHMVRRYRVLYSKSLAEQAVK